MGLVGTVVDAAIGWLVQRILELFTGQMKAWTREVGLAEDVENLKIEMESVEMVLAAAKGRRIDNEPLARKLDDLKELLYDAEDVMDELDYYRLQQQIEEGKGCRNAVGTNHEENYVSSSTPSSTFQLVRSWASRDRKRKREEDEPTHSTMLPLENKHDISKRIDGILNCLRSIRNSVQVVLPLEISRPIATSNQSMSVARNTRLTTSVPIEYKVYGRDAEREKIIGLLINGNSSDLHVLPIVGGGGVGKTALARFVCDDQRIISHFDLQMWACVSTIFDRVRLTREMLEHVCKDGQDYGKISSFNVLQDTLLKNIRNKRFLLVLDDIWEDKDKIGWVNLLAPLKRNQVPGCMILVTTRSKSVAKMIGTMDAVEMKGLDEKEFWLLFEACAFGNENCTDHPTLHTIGQQIAKTLKGNPLAAQSVGALLKENLSHEHWRDVQETWKSRQENDGDILPILELSYDYLPSHLQHCFSYCSLFPEDHRFNGETLVRAWISQNFVQSKDTSKRLEEKGMQYLYRLVDLGFFQKVGSHYVMHDLMHELAEKVSSNECATINGSEYETIQPSVRHLSIITTAYDKDGHCNFPSEKFENILRNIGSLKKLRTLMFFGLSSINLLRSLHTLCNESKSLRFLRIYVTGANVSSTHNLLKPYHLRYLEFFCVSTTNISTYVDYENTAFPQALTKFYHLQVLDVSIQGNFGVPTGMNNLVNLRHLIAHEKVHSAISSVGNLTSLQELTFKVQNVGNFDIRQLRSMSMLVTLGISQLENVKTKEEASGARLKDKKDLEELSLSWDDSSMSLEPTKERTRDVLEGLEPHPNLKHLQITGYSGATSPTWLASNVSITSLQTLHLENCREWRILGSLEMLPLLTKLTLVRMWNLTEVSIPSLEELVFVKMPKLEKCIVTVGLELTSRLRVLRVNDCPKLNGFTLSQSDSPPQQFSPSQGEQKEWVSSLRILTICDCPNLIVSQPLPPSALISELSIEGVPTFPTMKMRRRWLIIKSTELSVLDDKILAFHNLRGITSLNIQNCPNLVSLPSECFNQLTTLQTLRIENCPNLLKSHIMSESVQEDITSANSLVLPSLKCLFIWSCGIAGRCLTQMLLHLLSLEELSLCDCPQIKLVSISQPTEAEETDRLASAATVVASSAQDELVLKMPSNLLSSLKRLRIYNFQDQEFCGGNVGFGGFTSLEELAIRGGCPKLLLGETKDDGTVDETLLPPSLQELIICSLPANMHCFPSFPKGLKKLVLYCNPYLKCVKLHSCTALERLQISGCGQLAVLEGLQFLSSLRSLVIEMNCELSAAWDLKLQEQEQGGNQIGLLPPSLNRLGIRNLTDEVQSRLLSCLPRITKLGICYSPILTSLQLGYCTALEELEIRSCESLASIEGLHSIRNLRLLIAGDSPSLPPCLELLSQQQGASEIWSRLETLKIGDGSVLTMSLCKELTSLRHLEFFTWRGRHGESMVSLTEEQDRALQLLTSLQQLSFVEYPNLLSLPANLRSLASLERLKIDRCPSIARLPEMGLPPSLKQLFVSRCSEELYMQCRMAATEKLSVTIGNY